MYLNYKKYLNVHFKFIQIYFNAHLEGSPCPSSVIHHLVPFQGG
jgi:hypothetical protein